MKLSKELVELITKDREIDIDNFNNPKTELYTIELYIASDIFDTISGLANRIRHNFPTNTYPISAYGKFNKELAQSFIDVFDINPYDATTFLNLLYDSLVNTIEKEELKAAWGQMYIDENCNLALALNGPEIKLSNITKRPIQVEWL
jgi:hypothetical protein